MGGTTDAGGGEDSYSCGNDVVEPGEDCDDGNVVNADGCEGDCTLPACNNGIIDPGELCFEIRTDVPRPTETVFGLERS